METEEHTGEKSVLAVFTDTKSPGVVDCYAHPGQHGVAHPDYAESLPKATKEQYEPLVRELAAIGSRPRLDPISVRRSTWT